MKPTAVLLFAVFTAAAGCAAPEAVPGTRRGHAHATMTVQDYCRAYMAGDKGLNVPSHVSKQSPAACEDSLVARMEAACVGDLAAKIRQGGTRELGDLAACMNRKAETRYGFTFTL